MMKKKKFQDPQQHARYNNCQPEGGSGNGKIRPCFSINEKGGKASDLKQLFLFVFRKVLLTVYIDIINLNLWWKSSPGGGLFTASLNCRVFELSVSVFRGLNISDPLWLTLEDLHLFSVVLVCTCNQSSVGLNKSK